MTLGGAQGRPRRAKVLQVGAKRGSKEPKSSPRWPQGRPKRTLGWTKESPKGAQGEPKGNPREPKRSPEATQRSPMDPKGSPSRVQQRPNRRKTMLCSKHTGFYSQSGLEVAQTLARASYMSRTPMPVHKKSIYRGLPGAAPRPQEKVQITRTLRSSLSGKLGRS